MDQDRGSRIESERAETIGAEGQAARAACVTITGTFYIPCRLTNWRRFELATRRMFLFFTLGALELLNSVLLGSWFVNPASHCMPNYSMQGTALGATSNTKR